MNVNWEPEDDFEAMIAAAEGFDDQWPPSPTQSIPDFTRPTPDHPDPSHAEPMGNDMLPGSPLTRPHSGVSVPGRPSEIEFTITLG